jgi:hypothetical protein
MTGYPDRPELVASPPATIYRVGKYEDAWTRRPPSLGEPSASRYDDPIGRYRTIYAASTRYDAYLAVLAELTPGPNADLESTIEIEDVDRRSTHVDDRRRRPDAVARWISKRYLGQGTLNGRFADLTNPTTVDFLRHRLANLFTQHQITRFDPDVLTYAPREVTMEISRCISELEVRIGERFDGLFYRSRLAGGIGRWAIFDKDLTNTLFAVTSTRSHKISLEDPDLLRALNDCNIYVAPSSLTIVEQGLDQPDAN